MNVLPIFNSSFMICVDAAPSLLLTFRCVALFYFREFYSA